MQISKLSLLSIVTICTIVRATPNFDLVNTDPKTPIYVQANGGPWQILDETHYRFPIEVAENSLLIISLSAYEDKSAPSSLIFAPERAFETAKQINPKITKAPTFYVQAQIVAEKAPNSENIIKRVKLSPQVAHGTENKTKTGLPLQNNVNQEIIDMIIEIASAKEDASQSQPIIKKVFPAQQEEEPIIKTVRPELIKHEEFDNTKIQEKKIQAIGPMSPTTMLQHTDTPHMIATTLKNLSGQCNKKDRRSLWIEMRNYLITPQAQEALKGLDDATIYNKLKEHYQALSDKTKSNLKQLYTEIIDRITKAYNKYPKTNRKSRA